LSGKCDDVFGQHSFVIGPAWRFALRRSVLPKHTAYPSLGDSHHPSDVIDTAPSTRGA
jgi:hypothetical protein